ncbi:diguanylate cyclase [Aquabacterium sp. A7-Y]|uniref:GGDEF domain-containing protein n=1 Tax=Aquabacterium sp. A7-Y TaxID=1349605 RepID=UPI00223E1500|nr:diguanylate cyclase [Aquabacterium sp. A7-Y]MCW7541712.1 diguanylate cyclase [Aquabacterium sp. A7-Y]
MAVARDVCRKLARSLRGGSLGRQVALGTIGFCLVFTLVTVAVRTWSAWHATVDAMRQELAQIDKVFERTLAKAIWEMDRDALRTHLASAAQVASVGRVELKIRQANRPPEVLDHRQSGWTRSARMPSLQRTLSYEPYEGAREPVGELTLDGDERVLWKRLQAEVTSIVITQIIQSLLLAGLIMWMFNRSVTVHVKHIARHLAAMSPDTLQDFVKLERPPRRDELSRLEEGVNHLQGSLYDYLARQRQYERELAAHRDRLAELVHDRTKELESAIARLEELSRCDPLTGLPNRRHFDEMKDVELRRARRSQQPLSVLLCDVDFFKRFNDAYGHASGDRCLQAVAEVLKQNFSRAGELPARIGGEEFAVLLPGVDSAGAVALGERLCLSVAQRQIPHKGSEAAPYVTLSVGVAQFDEVTMDRFDVLLQHADEALYRAKRDGRNRVAS